MVRHHAPVIWTLLVLFLLSPLPGAWAGPPTDQLRAGVDRVLKILEDPELAGPTRMVQRRAALSKVAGEFFDFGEMAKRSLGQHWEVRTASQRGEFVSHRCPASCWSTLAMYERSIKSVFKARERSGG